jgi:hypothetical protein
MRGRLAQRIYSVVKHKPPNYRKQGYYQVFLSTKWLKLVDKKIRFPLGKQVKAWF